MGGGQKLNNITAMPLGELGTFTRGSGLQKKDFTPAGIGCIHYGQIYTYYGTCAKKTKSFVSQELALKARKAKYGDLVIATTSENDEDVCKAVAWLGDEDIAISGDACFYTHTMNPKYVAYYFQTEQFQKQKRSFITGTKVRRVNTKDLAKIEIPVPPLAEQQRIVAILDDFDTLTTSISEGLPKEIELRRKQYEYYRDQLLSFHQ
ncbi:type I restriction modification DNA specificity domain protein [Segatella buccae D17]|nr:type I restriction modification DNA specificity domain protein [Segatella buccae D17]